MTTEIYSESRVLSDTVSLSCYNGTLRFLTKNKSFDLLFGCCFSCLPLCDRLHSDL